jgi:hypothetical protein
MRQVPYSGLTNVSCQCTKFGCPELPGTQNLCPSDTDQDKVSVCMWVNQG